MWIFKRDRTVRHRPFSHSACRLADGTSSRRSLSSRHFRIPFPPEFEACALWGFRGCSADAGWSGRGRETVRRGAIEPEEEPKSPHRAFVQGQNVPVRTTAGPEPAAHPLYREGAGRAADLVATSSARRIGLAPSDGAKSGGVRLGSCTGAHSRMTDVGVTGLRLRSDPPERRPGAAGPGRRERPTSRAFPTG